MAIANLRSVVDFYGLRSAIKECRIDFFKQYSAGAGRDEALSRVRGLEEILLVSTAYEALRGRFEVMRRADQLLST